MTNETPQLTYPDINESFIQASCSNDVCGSYINLLNNTGIFYHNQYANKLYEFIESDKNKPFLEIEYTELRNFLAEWSKEHNVQVIIKIRKKDWIGFNAKIRLFQSLNRDLDEIRDLLGFKLILCTGYPDTAENHKLCYELMNDILTFFAVERRCLLLNPEDNSGEPLNPSSPLAQKIFIYHKNKIKSEFISKVKNYLIAPKEDGYQGLHSYIKSPSGLTFEIQIHTTATETHAKSLHKTYKDERYANIKFHIDYHKINIPGVVFDTKGNILSDFSGIFLCDSNLFNRV